MPPKPSRRSLGTGSVPPERNRSGTDQPTTDPVVPLGPVKADPHSSRMLPMPERQLSGIRILATCSAHGTSQPDMSGRFMHPGRRGAGLIDPRTKTGATGRRQRDPITGAVGPKPGSAPGVDAVGRRDSATRPGISDVARKHAVPAPIPFRRVTWRARTRRGERTVGTRVAGSAHACRPVHHHAGHDIRHQAQARKPFAGGGLRRACTPPAAAGSKPWARAAQTSRWPPSSAAGTGRGACRILARGSGHRRPPGSRSARGSYAPTEGRPAGAPEPTTNLAPGMLAVAASAQRRPH